MGFLWVWVAVPMIANPSKYLLVLEHVYQEFAALAYSEVIIFIWSMIEQLPIAALVGVMVMVAIGTFEWISSCVSPKQRYIRRMLVAVITILAYNLTLAVFDCDVIISTLVFAWGESAKRIRAKIC
jgi:SulP family sulfate permease